MPQRTTDAPRSEAELEDRLASPTNLTVDAVSRLGGDLMLLGAGGKMGPSLALLAKRSLAVAGLDHRVICVSRFGDAQVTERLHRAGIETVSADLLDRSSYGDLPTAPNIVYLAGFKFGATAAPHRTWAMNAYLPGIVAEHFCEARIVALSTGNVYPHLAPATGGASEATPPAPVGEYAQSCLARERMFEYMADTHGTRSVLVRLNYATDLRYGVLLDIAKRVAAGGPVDVSMGWINTIWQADANAVLLAAFDLCSAPPEILNLTGPETIAVRDAAQEFARLLDRDGPNLVGSESDVALLSDASRCHDLFGTPQVDAQTLIQWTAAWVRAEQPTLGKPTHFETRDGKF